MRMQADLLDEEEDQPLPAKASLAAQEPAAADAHTQVLVTVACFIPR